jgi:DNA polymerase
MVIGDAPSARDLGKLRPITSTGTQGKLLDLVLREFDLDREDIYVTNAVKCPAGSGETRNELWVKRAQAECADYLEEEIRAVRPQVVLAMGASAYWFFTRTAGLMRHRGRSMWDGERGLWVVPTVHPGYVLRYPAYYQAFAQDVSKFRQLLLGVHGQPRVSIVEVRDIGAFREMAAEVAAHDGILTFDLETRGFIDFRPDFAKLWCAALSTGRRDADGAIVVWLVPAEHPDSPFVDRPEELREVVLGVADLVEAGRSSGHNVKFDMRNIRNARERLRSADDGTIARWARELRSGILWSKPLGQVKPERGAGVALARKVGRELLEELLAEAQAGRAAAGEAGPA